MGAPPRQHEDFAGCDHRCARSSGRGEFKFDPARSTSLAEASPAGSVRQPLIGPMWPPFLGGGTSRVLDMPGETKRLGVIAGRSVNLSVFEISEHSHTFGRPERHGVS